ncbi:phycobilisome linker polypeptide [Leptolyngbya sp. FACHB-541]|uniref:phycobilisome linker polypeptide n=1 Tax=Leptolyngbya sp. FACHB-541 TaxID=2692810 RepID=UPI0016897431|nr:phycobilisome linker polypeptide [Leptolyngbya sp. FACHB-541]MBD1999988.1 phycobilisome linker polypeptide [Leptolyngbya sp. FACHB-541]
MFGQAIQGSNSFTDSAARMFLFEVKGLRQTYQSDKLSYPIRRSGNAVVAVPYTRMNEEMQRINRLGGTIVSIKPLNGAETSNGAKQQATAAHADAKVAHTENSSEG